MLAHCGGRLLKDGPESLLQRGNAAPRLGSQLVCCNNETNQSGWTNLTLNNRKMGRSSDSREGVRSARPAVSIEEGARPRKEPTDAQS